MSRRWFHGTLTAAAALALTLIAAAFILAQFNRSAQRDINARQQFINQNIELSRVNQTLVQAVAVAAVRNHDTRLRAMLAAQGIRINEVPSAAAAPTAPAQGPTTSVHPRKQDRP